MVKILNLVKAAVLFLGMVWGMYGNNDVTKINKPPQPKPELQKVSEPPLNQKEQLELRKSEYPTIDLTKATSRTGTVSAPLKTSSLEHGGLP